MCNSRIAAAAGLALVALAVAHPSQAQTYSVEIIGGTAINFTTPSIVHQKGYPDIDTEAHYDTKPFGPKFPYHAVRISRWSGDGAWEFSQVHKRLFLSDPPADVAAQRVDLSCWHRPDRDQSRDRGSPPD